MRWRELVGDLIGDGLLMVMSMLIGGVIVFGLHVGGMATPMPQVYIGIAVGSFIGLMLAKYVRRAQHGE